MRSRSPAAASVVLAALALTACGIGGGGGDGAGNGDPGEPPLPPEEAPAELELPEDAVLGLVGIVTASNGATADIAIVVHATLPYLAPEAAKAMETTIAWCAGEVDESVITGRGFSFTAVDVTLTPRDDTWPDDLILAVLPRPNPEFGSTLAVAEGLRQVEASATEGDGDYVPHCLQPAVLEGAGGGTVYLGIPSDISGANDAESFTAWTRHDFGLSAVLPGDLGTSEVTFSSCVANITQLGTEFGAPSAAWAERFDDVGCVVGGAST